MATRLPQIVAFGGGGFSMEAGNPLLDDYVLGLTGADRPRVCFLPTASGDADHYIVRFYRHFAGACEASHVSLFRRDRCGQAVEGDIAGHLLAQDLIYVGGGNVVSMLGAWRAHGLDAVLRRAWRRGAPWNAVSDSANQHSEPAEGPHMTTPRRHARRSTASSPCALQAPSMLTTLPPPT